MYTFAHFWQFSCNVHSTKILLRITHLSMRQLIIEKGFGGEAEHFGGEASPLPPPLDRTLRMTLQACLYAGIYHGFYLYNYNS